MAIAEFVAAFLILAFGGGAAIVTAIAFGDLSPAQLIVANGFDEPPDWFLDVALAVIFGLPLAAPAYLPWAATWASDISKHVTGAALLLAAVSIAMGIWLGLDLGDVLDGGSWQSVTGWIALIGPPLVGVPYLFVFHRARGAAPAGAER